MTEKQHQTTKSEAMVSQSTLLEPISTTPSSQSSAEVTYKAPNSTWQNVDASDSTYNGKESINFPERPLLLSSNNGNCCEQLSWALSLDQAEQALCDLRTELMFYYQRKLVRLGQEVEVRDVYDLQSEQHGNAIAEHMNMDRDRVKASEEAQAQKKDSGHDISSHVPQAMNVEGLTLAANPTMAEINAIKEASASTLVDEEPYSAGRKDMSTGKAQNDESIIPKVSPESNRNLEKGFMRPTLRTNKKTESADASVSQVSRPLMGSKTSMNTVLRVVPAASPGISPVPLRAAGRRNVTNPESVPQKEASRREEIAVNSQTDNKPTSPSASSKSRFAALREAFNNGGIFSPLQGRPKDK